MPIATQTQPAQTETIANLKAGVDKLALNGDVGVIDLRTYSHFDATPVLGTEFRDYSRDGKPTLSIKEVLADDRKIKALGRLV